MNLDKLFEKQRSISISSLLERFDYDEEGGRLLIRKKKPEDFNGGNKKAKATLWNRKYAGKVAGVDSPSHGIIYRRVMINGVSMPLHQVIWAIHYGEWPFSALDHIDGRGLNNRITNLRKTDHTLNMRNRKLGSNNSSGLNGLRVYVGKNKTSFRIVCRLDGSYTNRTFDTLFEAACFRKKWELDNSFTDRHGEQK
jgi:hypothetical protein